MVSTRGGQPAGQPAAKKKAPAKKKQIPAAKENNHEVIEILDSSEEEVEVEDVEETDAPIPSTLHPPAERTRPPPGTKYCAHCFSTEHVSSNCYCSTHTHHYDLCLAAATFCPDCHDKIEEGPSSLTPVGSALDVYCPMCKRPTCGLCNMFDKWVTEDGEPVCEDCYGSIDY
mmetsp:Transcript_16549/g.30942  ORF Transcript_16549/g.30942 Transcript_16549/m.30942 type:complete len:172 (+) Transcript_16549:213-728(+)|eukprot:CAMPEP_0182498332 /NCGR_PEP_ID=MMETSP1321-20130603/6560_1 /TAXON_ID=91990 /ORGANISM="Bolidomonas sp., Strain RCC1657" /LENGTH=171 /DNA_ID=CAMNT_0024702373 /DNA_START=128 /DNA_END=646 /DNA_ORIENTATION=+